MGPDLWRNKAAEAGEFKAEVLEVGGVEDEGAGNVTREEGVVPEVEVCEGRREGGREGP